MVWSKKRNGNEFTQKGGAFRDEVNVDLLWASDMPYGDGGTRRMPAGVAYILDSTDIPKGENHVDVEHAGNPRTGIGTYYSSPMATAPTAWCR